MMMSTTNTTTITTTSSPSTSATNALAEAVVMELHQGKSKEEPHNPGDIMHPTPQTNGITEARVNVVDVDIVDTHPNPDNPTTPTPNKKGIQDPKDQNPGKEYSSSSSETGKTIDANGEQIKINPYLLDGESAIDSSSVGVPRPPSFEGSDQGPVPKFRVEGSGSGDSSVTVVGVVPECCNGGSGPNSEDMKLSLVSWYSEPGEERGLSTSTTSCCDGGSGGHGGVIRQSHSLTNSLIVKSGSEEKENQTPEPDPGRGPSSSSSLLENGHLPDSDLGGSRESVRTLQGEEGHCPNTPSPGGVKGKVTKNNRHSRSQNHVKLLETENTKNCLNSAPSLHSNAKNGTVGASCDSLLGGRRRPECLKCSRRSRSGHATPSTLTSTSTPTSTGRLRTPASRRLMPSTKSSTELKKPIKSILKSDSHSRSGSGSDNKSSLDSLGSGGVDPSRSSRCLTLTYATTPLRSRGTVQMSRSEGSTTRAKFNLNHEIFSANANSDAGSFTPAEAETTSSEERIASKLKRIEKYATLRFRKTRVKPMMDLGSDPNIGGQPGGSKGSTPTTTDPNLMTKSMSFLEKGIDNLSLPFIPGNNHPTGSGNYNSTTNLKRQASLRMKKGTSPQWEPSMTKTTALRMQKMQETKAKQVGGHGVNGNPYSAGGIGGGGAGSVSTHSGSGDSIHHAHQGHSHSAPPSNKVASAEKQKVFAKLSSAFGQTASSNQKRLRQEKGIQTDTLFQMPGAGDHVFTGNGRNAASMSPIPAVDTTTDLMEQVHQLQKLANHYRSSAQKFQSEYEKSEAKKTELIKQLQETQVESGEMIEFLQAEKFTLAESLAEVETETKKLRDQTELAETRISILTRLGESHKQEAKNSTELHKQLESQLSVILGSISNQIGEGKGSIAKMKDMIKLLTENLIKRSKVPMERFELVDDCATGERNASSKVKGANAKDATSSETEPFPKNGMETNEDNSQLSAANDSKSTAKSGSNNGTDNLISDNDNGSSQAKTPGAAEDQELGLDQIKLSQLMASFPEVDDESCFTRELFELESAVNRLRQVVEIIVVNANERITGVVSSIQQCLRTDDVMPMSPVHMASFQEGLKWLDENSDYSAAFGLEADSSQGSYFQDGNESTLKTSSNSKNVQNGDGSSSSKANGHSA